MEYDDAMGLFKVRQLERIRQRRVGLALAPVLGNRCVSDSARPS